MQSSIATAKWTKHNIYTVVIGQGQIQGGWGGGGGGGGVGGGGPGDPVCNTNCS